jgi:DNA-binding XRE family transcriptional regulator
MTIQEVCTRNVQKYGPPVRQLWDAGRKGDCFPFLEHAINECSALPIPVIPTKEQAKRFVRDHLLTPIFLENIPSCSKDDFAVRYIFLWTDPDLQLLSLRLARELREKIVAEHTTKAAKQTLKKLRTDAGLTQGGLASKVGIDESTLGRIERGRQKPSPATARAIADALSGTGKLDRPVHPDDLLPEPRNARKTPA